MISVAAELAGVHPQTLRIYERKGLVDPARTGGGSRRYSDADISQLKRIQELTNEGLNLAGVKRVLELEAALEQAHNELDEARRQASAAVDRTHRQYRRDLVPLKQAVVLFRGAQSALTRLALSVLRRGDFQVVRLELRRIRRLRVGQHEPHDVARVHLCECERGSLRDHPDRHRPRCVG